jgi:hypothetical protein
MPTTQAPPTQTRKGENLNVWLPSELMTAFRILCERNRRSRTTTTRIFFETCLADEGLWPPPEGNEKAPATTGA